MLDLAAVRRVILALNQIDNVYYQFACKCNMGENKLILLYALNDGQGHSQKEITENWQIPKTTVNSIVKDLKSCGYIRLTAVPGQRREQKMWLTDTGIAYANEALRDVYHCELESVREIQAEYPDFIQSLERFSHTLSEKFSHV